MKWSSGTQARLESLEIEVLDRMKKDAKKSHGGHYELGDAAGADIPVPAL